ncbi:hypothetical protein PoB_002880200 [Plakobranchus ocellatus]|uniref:Uncharacterized protein n=1 Tax=Plakobranchus ocellatus TaxID=259542 RepID=A0AAV4A5X3_9GAST|nr:hypothetical protein PoB_002880200 [Plakobranchus ocellatus]
MLSGSSTGQGAVNGPRTRDRRNPADVRAVSLSTVPTSSSRSRKSRVISGFKASVRPGLLRRGLNLQQKGSWKSQGWFIL